MFFTITLQSGYRYTEWATSEKNLRRFIRENKLEVRSFQKLY